MIPELVFRLADIALMVLFTVYIVKLVNVWIGDLSNLLSFEMEIAESYKKGMTTVVYTVGASYILRASANISIHLRGLRVIGDFLSSVLNYLLWLGLAIAFLKLYSSKTK